MSASNVKLSKNRRYTPQTLILRLHTTKMILRLHTTNTDIEATHHKHWYRKDETISQATPFNRPRMRTALKENYLTSTNNRTLPKTSDTMTRNPVTRDTMTRHISSVGWNLSGFWGVSGHDANKLRRWWNQISWETKLPAKPNQQSWQTCQISTDH